MRISRAACQRKKRGGIYIPDVALTIKRVFFFFEHQAKNTNGPRFELGVTPTNFSPCCCNLQFWPLNLSLLIECNLRCRKGPLTRSHRARNRPLHALTSKVACSRVSVTVTGYAVKGTARVHLSEGSARGVGEAAMTIRVFGSGTTEAASLGSASTVR